VAVNYHRSEAQALALVDELRRMDPGVYVPVAGGALMP
jgi:hypothetical protein